MTRKFFPQMLESSCIPVSSAIGRFPTCILCAGVAVGHSILELVGDLLVAAVTANRDNGSSNGTSNGASNGASNNGANNRSRSIAQMSASSRSVA